MATDPKAARRGSLSATPTPLGSKEKEAAKNMTKGRGYASFMEGIYIYIFKKNLHGWIAFLFVGKGETHPIGYVSLVDSVSSAAPNGLQLLGF